MPWCSLILILSRVCVALLHSGKRIRPTIVCLLSRAMSLAPVSVPLSLPVSAPVSVSVALPTAAAISSDSANPSISPNSSNSSISADVAMAKSPPVAAVGADQVMPSQRTLSEITEVSLSVASFACQQCALCLLSAVCSLGPPACDFGSNLQSWDLVSAGRWSDDSHGEFAARRCHRRGRYQERSTLSAAFFRS